MNDLTKSPEVSRRRYSSTFDTLRRTDPILGLFGLLCIGIPLLPANINNPNWHGLKTSVFEIGTALALVVLPVFGCRNSRLRFANIPFWTPLFLSALILWALYSYVTSSTPAFSFNGWWLIAAGFVIMMVVAGSARHEPGLHTLLIVLATSGVVISFYAFAVYQSAGMKVAEGPYHDHQLLGASLILLLPYAVTLWIAKSTTSSRLLGSLAVFVIAAALLLSQDRSSWLGVLVAILVFFILSTWRRVRVFGPRRSTHIPVAVMVQGGLPVLVVIGAIVYFVFMSPQAALIQQRAWSLGRPALSGQDASEQWRFRSWHGALDMIRSKPFRGWGVGDYPVFEGAFTGQGDMQSSVELGGAHLGDEAHNSYLQFAVELGLPGLLLWVLVLGSAFMTGVRALTRLPIGCLRQFVLIGGLSALAGQAVDSFANPAWQFGEVAIYLWVTLGLILAAAAPPSSSEDYSGVVAMASLWAALRWAGAVIGVWAIFESIRFARYLPIPHL